MNLGLALDQGDCTGAALFSGGLLIEAKGFRGTPNPDLVGEMDILASRCDSQWKKLWRWLHDHQMDLGRSIDVVIMEEFQKHKDPKRIDSVNKLFFRTGYLRAMLAGHLPISCRIKTVNKRGKPKDEAQWLARKIGYTGKNKDVMDAIYHGVLGGLHVGP